MRTLIYCRVSTDEQVERYGLQAQLRACREYAALNGLEVIEEIADEGITGAILERPGLERVRALARQKAVDVVLTLDPDRLSRDLEYLLRVKKEIERSVRLQFVMVSFENSSAGRLFFSMKGAIAEYEREQIRERTMRGRKERAKLGLWCGGRCPYGYRYDGQSLVPDQERATIARQIFDWYEAGLSIREVTRRLRECGAPTWGGGRWGHSSVRRILGNELYTGVAHYGPETLVVPALLDRERWERIGARLQANPRMRVGRPSAKYLLRGAIYCRCGLRMYGEQSKGSLFYRCRGRNRMRFETPCTCSVNAVQLDSAAWREIVQAFTDASYLRGVFRDRQAQLRAGDPGRLEQLHGRVRKLRTKESQALGLMLDPDFEADRGEIKRRYREMQQERARVEAEVREIERASSPARSDWLEDAVGLFRRQLPKLTDPEMRQRFLGGILTRADWDGKELNMRLFLAPKLDTSVYLSGQFQPLELTLKARLAA